MIIVVIVVILILLLLLIVVGHRKKCEYVEEIQELKRKSEVQRLANIVKIKKIEDTYRIGKLDQNALLASYLFRNLDDSEEIPERISAYYYIEPNDVVLELGGNVGGVSQVIASKLKNPSNLVVIEPGYKEVRKLKELAGYYGFNIYNGPIVSTGVNVLCKYENANSYINCKKVHFPVKNNITFSRLQKLFGLRFNVLVIDCEGCYEDILEEGLNTDLFDGIEKILIEWDGTFMEKQILDAGFVLVDILPHKGLEKGVRVYLR